MKDLNIPLEKLIASKDIIAQFKKEKRVFTPFEQAVLIYQNPKLTHEEMLNLLKQIQDAVKDEEEYKELYQQLEERIKFQVELEKRFYSGEENQYFNFSYKDAENMEIVNDDSFFSDLHKLLDYIDDYFKRYGIKAVQSAVNGKFTVHKHYLNSNDIEITAVFDGQNKIKKIYSYSLDTLIDYTKPDNFANAFVEIPFPFRNGDFVHVIGNPQIGIFTSCKDEEDYRYLQLLHKRITEKGLNIDASDISCRVELLAQADNSERLYFYHYHPSLLSLEYAELKESDEHYELLKSAQALMQGKGSLETFCGYLNVGNK